MEFDIIVMDDGNVAILSKFGGRRNPLNLEKDVFKIQTRQVKSMGQA